MSVNNILGANGKISAQYLPGVAVAPDTVLLGNGTGAATDENVGVIDIDGNPTFSVEIGGVYCIQGTYSFTTGGVGFDIIMRTDNGDIADSQIIVRSEAASYEGSGALVGVGLPFACVFVAQVADVSLQLENLGGGAVGVTTNVVLSSIFLTRIA
jgi:hypothetical protein